MRDDHPGLVLAAPDAFKGSLSAAAVADAVAEAALARGWQCDRCPLSDGGEGFGAVVGGPAGLGGTPRTAMVDDALGRPVPARWWLAGEVAVVESAEAGGLARLGGAGANDPVAATSRGTGQLLVAAARAGARRIVVGVGGSASTDGGAGALAAVRAAGGLGPVAVQVACDVDVGFTAAARVFAPQKGADPHQVADLERRLQRLADDYRRQGVDVTALPGAGAAGGLAGGLAVLGAELRSGADVVADLVDLDRRVSRADLVVSGEGRVDATTWQGKVVDAVVRRAAAARRPVLVVAGQVAAEAAVPARRVLPPSLQLVSLSDTFGARRSHDDPAACIRTVVAERLGDAGAQHHRRPPVSGAR